jgi:hypothetical protein
MCKEANCIIKSGVVYTPVPSLRPPNEIRPPASFSGMTITTSVSLNAFPIFVGEIKGDLWGRIEN